jgi:MerR family transcriptional regulator, copper efflux regulator
MSVNYEVYSKVKRRQGAIMLIKELAQKVGLSTHTIRYYEKENLIPKRYIKRESNNYRQYSQEAVDRLIQIRILHEIGFTLSEIQALLDKWDSGLLSPSDGEDLLQHKLEEIDSKIAELRRIKVVFMNKLGAHIKQATSGQNPKNKHK